MKDDDNKWWEKTDICAPAGKGELKEIDYHRYWKDMYEKEHEALANALEVSESHQKLNGKLQMRITELEQENLELYADNKKISKQVEDQVERARKAGM